MTARASQGPKRGADYCRVVGGAAPDFGGRLLLEQVSQTEVVRVFLVRLGAERLEALSVHVGAGKHSLSCEKWLD